MLNYVIADTQLCDSVDFYGVWELLWCVTARSVYSSSTCVIVSELIVENNIQLLIAVAGICM